MPANVLPMSVETAAAGRPHTHDLLDAQPPVSALKESLSQAVVGLLASAAGLTLGTWSQDYDGFDVTLSSSHNYDPYAWGPKLDLQLKCTGQQAAQRSEHVSWQLDARTSNLLGATNRQTMSLLCVVVVPQHPGHWLGWPDEGLLAYCKAYFLRGQDIPVINDARASQTLHLPHANLLTAPVLLDLMEEAAKWRYDA